MSDGIFVKERSNSRLAKEYRHLTDSIIANNIRDVDGALLFLKRFVERYIGSSGGVISGDDREKLDEISFVYAANGKVLEAVARIYHLNYEYELSYSLLFAALEIGPKTSSILRKCAVVLKRLGRIKESHDYLKMVLDVECADEGDIISAIQSLAIEEATFLRDHINKAIERFSPEGRLRVATSLMASHDMLDISENILRSILVGNNKYEIICRAQIDFVLVLIGAGKFSAARDHCDSLAVEQRNINWYFNRAMACWGMGGYPDVEAFRIVTTLNGAGRRRSDPNYCLCMAIAYGVIDDVSQARAWLDTARGTVRLSGSVVFSPWRYLHVTPRLFRDDIDSVSRFIEAQSPDSRPRPEFIMRNENKPDDA